ncbi:MAG: DUF4870 domain-containing protein [Chroococcales cyanobacterium]
MNISPTESEKQWAMFSHLGFFAGFLFPFGNIIVPLAIWLIKREESAFIDEHGKEIVNNQISFTIYAIACIILMFTLIFLVIGLPLILILVIVNIIFVIQAALKAQQGLQYRYPLTFRFIQ